MSVRVPITVATVLFLAVVWYTTVTIDQPTAKSPSSRIAVSNQPDTETTAVRYAKLKAHVRETISLVEDVAEQWNERNAAHLQTSSLGRDVRDRIRAAMREESDMIARWKTTLRHIDDGDYEYAQALIEREKIDAESRAFMAELNAIVRDMQRIRGCHCGG
jgi:hypothetical protein